ncbi:hypothetical protein ABZX40_40545 [Streptomyces sp. NPDC004610]|uniref:hypothetical protein n=1 Tax=unclassified Streptomyces TaxID=2593676 RepID=UPI0033A44FBD
MVNPTNFDGLDDEDELPVEVTADVVARDRRAKKAAATTRRSWYTTAEAADALAAMVDDIHHATRVPKHQVVAALFEAAVAQGPRVQARLAKTRSHGSHSSHQ